MVVVETDFIVAISSPEDEHYEEATTILRKHVGKLKLSPYTLVELDLLVKSGRLRVKPLEYYESLGRLMEYYGVRIVEPRPQHLGLAWRLRQKYAALSYFDSLHAAVSIDLGEPIASYDTVYASIEELNYIPLSKLARYA